jgi:hypothetical protein
MTVIVDISSETSSAKCLFYFAGERVKSNNLLLKSTSQNSVLYRAVSSLRVLM